MKRSHKQESNRRDRLRRLYPINTYTTRNDDFTKTKKETFAHIILHHPFCAVLAYMHHPAFPFRFARAAVVGCTRDGFSSDHQSFSFRFTSFSTQALPGIVRVRIGVLLTGLKRILPFRVSRASLYVWYVLYRTFLSGFSTHGVFCSAGFLVSCFLVAALACYTHDEESETESRRVEIGCAEEKRMCVY